MARCHARFSAGRIVAGNDVRGYVPLHPDNSVWKIACEATKYREVAVALGCGASADRASASLLVAKVAVSFTFEDTRCAGDKHRIVACTNAHRGVTLNARDFNFQLPGKPEHYGNGRIQADLSLVLLHEVGHWLGLKHPTDGTKSIMSADLKDVTCISNDNVAMLLDPLQQALSLQSQSLEALIYTGPR